MYYSGISRMTRLTIGAPKVRYQNYGYTVLFVLLATSVGWLGRHFLLLTDLAIIYLYVIVVSALLFSLGPAVLASALSVFAFDFFFVPPILRLDIADVHYVFTFCMMFLVGLLVADLASRIRREQRRSTDREKRTAALFALSRDLGCALDESQAAEQLVRHTTALFDANSVLLLADSLGSLEVVAKTGDIALRLVERAAVTYAYEHGLVAGCGAEMHSSARIACAPLAAAGATIGVLAVESLPNIGFAEREVLESFARQGGVCVAGLRAADEVKVAEVRARTEAIRSALLTSVSHDFRTPLAVITEAATMLRDDAALLSPSQRNEMIVTVCEEAERMERLVANLLDMTRLESGELTLRREWVSAEELVGAALNIVKSRTTGLTVVTRLPPHLPLVAVDPSLMEQLLANIFENAAKYAGHYATVHVESRLDNTQLVIDIADDGPGLPFGTEERIFEKFYRATSTRTGGTGLGLAICRAIADCHGATIMATNLLPHGARFRVAIPIVGVPPDVPSEQDSTNFQ